MKKLFWFAFAGGSGFLVDAGTLWLLIHFTPVGPYLARILSIATAMAWTWTVNRTLTFGRSSRSLASEGARYGLVGLAAALVNYAVYSACLWFMGRCQPCSAAFADYRELWPVAATAVGSGVAMVVSYYGYSRLVFTSR